MFLGQFVCAQQKLPVFLYDQYSQSQQKITQKADSLQAVKKVNQWLEKAHTKGYMAAQIDSLFLENDQWKCNAFTGKPYVFGQIAADSLPLEFHKIFKKIAAKPFQYSFLSQTEHRILQYFQNIGYPFAQVQKKDVSIEQQTISFSYELQKGDYVFFDTLLLPENLKTQTAFLLNYLKLKQRQAFSRQKIDQIEKKIKWLPFLALQDEPQIRYGLGYASVFLPVKELMINKIDGFVGILPNTNTDLNRRILLTGRLHAKLYNLFGTGKQVVLDWQRLNVGAQKLDFQYEQLDFLHIGADLKAKLNYFKQDSIFFSFQRQLGATFYSHSLGRLTVEIGKFNSAILNKKFLQNTLNQDFADVKSTFLGLDWEFVQLNNRLFPTKGYKLLIRTQADSKSLQELKEDASWEKLFQFKWALHAEKHTPLGAQGVFFTSLRAAQMFTNKLFLNEMHRLGGIYSLRGFNENAFFAQNYAVFSAEYRLLTAEQSYVYLFFDQALMGYQLAERRFFDRPFGLGVGMLLRTKAGLFEFAYAFGNSKALAQPISFEQSRVHFGLSTSF